MNTIVINKNLYRAEISEIKTLLSCNKNYLLYASVSLPEELQSFPAKQYELADSDKKK